MSFHAGTPGVDGSQQLLSVQAFSAAATELKNEVLEKEREYLLNFEKLGEINSCLFLQRGGRNSGIVVSVGWRAGFAFAGDA